MKTSKEMADSVFKIRDEYEEKQRKKRNIRRKAVHVVSTACMFGVIFIGIKYSSSMKRSVPEIAVVDTSEDTETTDDTHQTTKVTESVSTSSIYSNSESTKESKINTVTEVSTNKPTEAAETDIDIPTTTESDINESDPDEPPTIRTEPSAIEQTEPPATEPQLVTTASLLAEDTSVQNATPPSSSDPQITDPQSIDWAYLPIEKQYSEAIFDGRIIYTLSEKEVQNSMIDGFFSDVDMRGFDGENEHLCIAKAYRIKGYDDNAAIAIKFEGNDKYYFYGFKTEID